MTAWIKMVSDDEASPEQRAAFDHARAPSGTLDNVMRVHSLRPHTMVGHYDLYMSVLHHATNRVPDWLLEVIASYVSILNECPYSLTNHFANARHLIADDAKADEILAALEADSPSDVFAGRELAALRYARQLTRHPGGVTRDDLEAMRRTGLDDGEILEVNQVCCYFNYVNRLLNGLGVTLEGDTVGYYSSET
jgi:uncharacterized peroxidase-related enzyme